MLFWHELLQITELLTVLSYSHLFAVKFATVLYRCKVWPLTLYFLCIFSKLQTGLLVFLKVGAGQAFVQRPNRPLFCVPAHGYTEQRLLIPTFDNSHPVRVWLIPS